MSFWLQNYDIFEKNSKEMCTILKPANDNTGNNNNDDNNNKIAFVKHITQLMRNDSWQNEVKQKNKNVTSPSGNC